MGGAWRFCFLLVALSSASLSGAGPARSQIVGGHEAKPHSRPYAAALKVNGHFNCGGFLIAPQWVMTAAHCHGGISVILGAHDLDGVEDTQQVFEVASYHKYPGYAIIGGVPFNDILLLKLEREAKLNEYIQVIPIPNTMDDLPKNTKCFVAGWGRIDARYEPLSKKLFKANVTAPGRRKCLRFHPELTQPSIPPGLLEREAKLNEYIQVIPIPKSMDDLPKNTKCFVAGWGRIDARYEPVSTKLFETNVTALGRRKCLRFDPELTDGMLCAGSRAVLCDVSNGDSGSALVCNGVAHGIVSYGFQIPPSMYTRVAAFLPWIQETMG